MPKKTKMQATYMVLTWNSKRNMYNLSIQFENNYFGVMEISASTFPLFFALIKLLANRRLQVTIPLTPEIKIFEVEIPEPIGHLLTDHHVKILKVAM